LLRCRAVITSANAINAGSNPLPCPGARKVAMMLLHICVPLRHRNLSKCEVYRSMFCPDPSPLIPFGRTIFHNFRRNKEKIKTFASTKTYFQLKYKFICMHICARAEIAQLSWQRAAGGWLGFDYRQGPFFSFTTSVPGPPSTLANGHRRAISSGDKASGT
jgi:hypothetical protein